VNGDGHPDLVVTNSCQTSACRNGGTVSVLLGNGDGSFQAPVSYSSDGINATSAAIADVNADGRPDVVMANYCVTTACENGSVGVLLNNITVCTAPPSSRSQLLRVSYGRQTGKCCQSRFQERLPTQELAAL
jgi:FG-GAP-like repeat